MEAKLSLKARHMTTLRVTSLTCILFSGAAILVSLEAAVVGQTTGKQVDLSAIRAEWNTYRKQVLSVGGHVVITERIEVNGKAETARAEVKYPPSFGALVLDDMGEDRKSARATNPRYSFELSQSGADGPWSISDVFTDSASVPLAIGVLEDTGISNLVAGLDIGGAYIDELVSNTSQCEVVDISESAINNVSLLCIRLSYTPKDKDDRCRVRRASCWVNPARRWLLERVEADCEYAAGERMSRTTTYHYDDRTSPLRVTKVSSVENNEEFDMKAEYQYEFIPSSLSKEDFMMSSFGMPEPSLMDFRKYRLWIVVVTVMLLGMLIYHSFRHRWQTLSQITE